MLFNSLQFAMFFPVVVAMFYLLPHRWRVHLLLVCSCIFYMAFIPAYILILFITILIDYVAGIYLEKVQPRRRLAILWVSIISTCTVLFIFKYFGFLAGTFVGLTSLFGLHIPRPVVSIILPIGLSFHTFQSLSYVIEVYRGRQKAEHNLVVYATYVMFFPQLVAGPIERPQNLIHQFRDRHEFVYENVTWGLKRMAWGFYKKLVVADRLALYVNDVYGVPRNYNGLQLTIATVFFAYQIYCDFSGYSDIAIGAARVLGFRLMENFDTPYYSQSISEFWRRWHISLSTWFKDYLYIPLGGNRVSMSRHILNLLITFAVSGLWHGANWTFVVWGVLNGVYLIFGMLTKDRRDKFFEFLGMPVGTGSRQVLMTLSTFVLTCVAWVVFRARNMGDAFYVFTHLGTHWNFHQIATDQFYLRQFPVAVGSIVLLEFLQSAKRNSALPSTIGRMPTLVRWAAYASLVMVVLMLGVYKQTQFIYFQF